MKWVRDKEGAPLWIDLLSPSKEEKKDVEKRLGISIPTREEMQEIESSSRLYKENGTLIMTLSVVKKESDSYKITNLTFLLKDNLLVTLRYDELSALTLFLKGSAQETTAVGILLGIVDAIIEKIADSLEAVSAKIEGLSSLIFREKQNQEIDLKSHLIEMGIQGEINSKARESLSTISRMVGFLKLNVAEFSSRLDSLSLDATDLKDHSSFLGHKIAFILDASLGLINIEQNKIIKIFSIAAVVLLPPTLVATIYGMNFHHMPELNWMGGYPIALLIIFLSALLPYWYIKKKRWL